MKFLYIASLLLPAVLAVDQTMHHDARDLDDAVDKNCDDLPKECSSFLHTFLKDVKKATDSSDADGVKASFESYQDSLADQPQCSESLLQCVEKVLPELSRGD